MKFVLFDDEGIWKNFWPFTYTRPLSLIRTGILTIAEKWEHELGNKAAFITVSYLQKKFRHPDEGPCILINSAYLPEESLVSAVKNLKSGDGIYQGNVLVACYSDNGRLPETCRNSGVEITAKPIREVWEIFTRNAEQLLADFKRVTLGRKSMPLSPGNRVIGDPSLIFLEEGAVAEAGIFNTTAGPVYIGKNAEIMEGSLVRGPFALCEHSALKMGAKVYGATTIGPHSKVGGEISNSVIFGYSNKAHDGFLGNSVVGEWCNLGADTNNSNLKNNYGNVKLYSFAEQKMRDTGLQFCGLMMGDHSKAGINTMFNTGTVVGVGANIFGGGFPATTIPSFSWGGSEGFEEYKLDKLFETAEKVFSRRGLQFDETERSVLSHIASFTAPDRSKR